jgi:hypothetical protein
LGCLTVYKQVPELVENLLGIVVNESQVYRICQHLSQALPTDQLNAPSPALAEQQAQGESILYGMIDGSMVFTDWGWQETKLGRVFMAQSQTDGALRPWIESSEYVAHRGHYGGFTPDFERLLPPRSAAQKVFVTDGAEWIGNWLSSAYPEATHILDYFHVVEKLALAVKGLPSGKKWLTTQQDHLLGNQSERVEKNVAELTHLASDEQHKLVGYLLNNRNRMRYGDYRKRGLLIGSGPIEAAHRTVLQVRMKRSGQRWVNTGCDNMIRLRVAYKSGKFDQVTNLLKTTQAKI